MKKNATLQLSSNMVLWAMVLLFLALPGTLLAQHTKTEYINQEHNHNNKWVDTQTICYGEKIAIASTPEINVISWKVSNGKQTLQEGIGSSLSNYVFDTPGNYIITFTDPNAGKHTHTCEHSPLPNEIHLTVLRYKIQYLFDRCVFSTPLAGGAVSNTILTIPVQIETYDGKPLDMAVTTVRTMGIAAEVQGAPIPQNTLLQPGTTTIQYVLNGTLRSNTYIMLGFFDPAGIEHAFSFTQPLK